MVRSIWNMGAPALMGWPGLYRMSVTKPSTRGRMLTASRATARPGMVLISGTDSDCRTIVPTALAPCAGGCWAWPGDAQSAARMLPVRARQRR